MSTTRQQGYSLAYDTPRVQPAMQSVTLVLTQDELPNRNPLHPYALNIAEIQVGMDIKHVNIGRGTTNRKGTVVRKPFRMPARSPVTGTDQVCWMIEVSTIDGSGKSVHQNWYLSEMGVVPFQDDSGKPHWNCQNYTMAA